MQGGQMAVIPSFDFPGGQIDQNQYKVGQTIDFIIKHIGNPLKGTIIPEDDLINRSDIYVGQILEATVVKHLDFGIVASLRNVFPFTTVLLPQSQCSKSVGKKSALPLLKTYLPLFTQLQLAITHVMPDGKLRGTILSETFREMNLDERLIKIRRPNDDERIEMKPPSSPPMEKPLQEPVAYAYKIDTSRFQREMDPFEMTEFDSEIDFSRIMKHQAPELLPSQVQKNQPRSEREFELLVAQQPDSSYIYLQYASFHLERANLEAALKVLDRGFDEIPQSSVDGLQERLNIQVAKLRIQLQFYGEEAFLQGVKQAFAMQAEPGRLCEQLISSLEGQPEIQEEVFAIFFNNRQRRTDFECQKLRLEHLYRTGREEQARKSIQNVINQVNLAEGQSTRQFLSFIARLEYKNGHAAEGRAAYERLIGQSKLDIILHYVDCEEAHGDMDYLRGLFRRLLERDYGSRRNRVVSVLLKKWLDAEKRAGESQRVQEIRQLAMQMLE